ncbi:MAG: hypothetical protein QM767_12860 [Anaeromyxobacter sp.]
MKRAAKLLLVLGALGVGWLLFAEGPRELVLVYDLGHLGPADLTVDLLRGPELVRHAEFHLDAGSQQVRHAVKLPDGDYRLRWATRGAAAAQGERTVEVREAGTQVFSLAP